MRHRESGSRANDAEQDGLHATADVPRAECWSRREWHPGAPFYRRGSILWARYSGQAFVR